MSVLGLQDATGTFLAELVKYAFYLIVCLDMIAARPVFR
jgi:hypothetical protein